MFRLTLTWLGLAALMATTGANALTLEEAAERVLASHPEIERREATVAATAAERDSAALAPPIVISAEAETALGADEASGTEATEGTLRISRVLERGGKRDLRRQAGQARVSRAVLEQKLARIELLAETTRRFTSVVVAEAQTEVASQRLTLAKDLLDSVERQAAAARRSAAEAHSARMEVGRARLELVRAEGALEASRARLSALWGDTTPGFDQADAQLFELGPMPSLQESLAALTNNPQLLRMAAEGRIADEQAALARSAQSADVTLSAGAKYFGELEAGGFVVGVSVPLGARARAAPAIRAAEQLTRASQLALAGRRRELEGVVAELIARLEASGSGLALVQETVIPEAEQAVRLFREGFEAGRHSFITVSEAQSRLIEARSEAIATARDFHRLMFELEMLTSNVEGAQL